MILGLQSCQKNPTRWVGYRVHSQQKYDVYSFDVIICDECIKQCGTSSAITEEHSVLANKLLEFGFSIIDKEEYESFFSKDAQ